MKLTWKNFLKAGDPSGDNWMFMGPKVGRTMVGAASGGLSETFRKRPYDFGEHTLAGKVAHSGAGGAEGAVGGFITGGYPGAIVGGATGGSLAASGKTDPTTLKGGAINFGAGAGAGGIAGIGMGSGAMGSLFSGGGSGAASAAGGGTTSGTSGAAASPASQYLQYARMMPMGGGQQQPAATPQQQQQSLMEQVYTLYPQLRPRLGTNPGAMNNGY